MKKTGFSIIEMILYVGIVAIFLGGAVLFSLNISYGRVKAQVGEDVHYGARFAGKRILYEIRNASAIQSVSSNSICLLSANATYNPVKIYLSGGAIRIGWGGGSPTCATTTNDQALTGSSVNVSSLNFTNVTTGVGDLTRHIRFSFTVSAKNTTGRQEYIAEDSYMGSAEVRSH